MAWATKEKQQEYDKIRYMKRRDYFINNMREWRSKNREWFIWKSAEIRAKKKNIPFDLEISDITIPDVCPIMKFPLSLTNSKISKDSPSLDRIVPELGYVKGNVWVISALANTMKQNATDEELKLFATWITNR